MLKLIKNLKVWPLAALITMDCLFFTKTNPSSATSSTLIVGFGLLIVSSYWIFRALIALFGLYSATLHKHRRRLAVCLTIIIGISSALQSIGQFSSKDVLVLVPLAVMLYLYMTYIKARPIRK